MRPTTRRSADSGTPASLWRVTWVVLCLALCSAASPAQPPSAREFELKAAYIYNFTKFAAWPEGTFAGESAPLVIGILGHDSLAEALGALVRNRAVQGRRIVVRTLTAPVRLEGLHVLYVAASQESLLGEPERLVADGLLTIGETEGFLALGGAIRFIVAGDRLQFEINAAAPERAGVRVSSQLLMLARSVHK